MALLASDLLTNIKRRAQLPDDGGTLFDSDILAMASDELQNVIFPRLLAMREWHYAFSYSQSLSSARTYRINHRTAAQGIISVEYLDGTNYRYIPYKHPLTQKATDGENYSVYGNNIVVSDSVASSGTLRIRALLRPSRLTTNRGIITSKDATTITCSANNNLTAIDSNDGVDISYATSPYEVVEVGLAATATSATVTTLTAGTPSTVAVGMIINNGGFSSSPQLPDELHDYLAQRTAIRCKEARGMTQDMDLHLRKLKDLETAFDRLASPRARGDFKAILEENWYIDRRI